MRLELSVSTALLSLRDAIQLLVGTHLPTADFRKCGRKVTELEVALRQIDCRRIAPTVPKLGVPRAHVERQCWSAVKEKKTKRDERRWSVLLRKEKNIPEKIK